MTCNERRELIDLLACDALQGQERSELLGHLRSGCPECAGALVEAEMTWAHLPLALEPVVPASSVKERLMRAVDGTPRQEVVRPLRRPASRGWLAPLGAAAAAAALTAFALVVPARRQRQVLEADLARQEQRLHVLQDNLEAARRTERALHSPSMDMVSLQGTEVQPNASARILWDRAHREWQLYATGLAPPAAGRTYELWFITAEGTKVPAGTFDVDAGGRGVMTVSVPDTIGAIAVAAVTDEPAGGVEQPTGSIHLAGSVGG